MTTTLILLCVGFILLLAGGEALVRGSVGLAGRLGLSPLVIGLTIVGFGTSTPELLVSVNAAYGGAPDIALGNVVGSNIANILLILGVAAAISPMALPRRVYARDLGIMLAASALLLIPVFTGSATRTLGLVMLLLLTGYLIWVLRSGDDELAVEPGGTMSWLRIGLFLPLGLAGLLVGAQWLVSSATDLARLVGISEAVIGLTIVAVGTSLPELATSVIAALRGQSGVAVGNVIGSNIFNILGILGVTAALVPIPVSGQIAGFDLPVMLGVALLLVLKTMLFQSMSRLAGCALLILYAAYLVWLF